MPKLTIIRRHGVIVSVTAGDNIRVEPCKSLTAATALETRLRGDIAGARRWMLHREPEQLELPLEGGVDVMFRRVDD